MQVGKRKREQLKRVVKRDRVKENIRVCRSITRTCVQIQNRNFGLFVNYMRSNW